MDEKVQQERIKIAAELRKSLMELDRVAYGIRKDFYGIGNEYCAQCLDGVVKKLSDTARSLESMDMRVLNRRD